MWRTRRRAGDLQNLDLAVTTIALDTGEILATHTINPNRNYWPNTQKEPGRWPNSS